MITILGIQIYEFTIAFSDLILFIESIFFASLLYKKNRHGFFLFLFLGMSSLLGAIFHAFFPLKAESPGGFIIWMLTTAIIGLVTVTILYTITHLLNHRFLFKIIHIFTLIFLGLYLYMIMFVDYDYPMVIRFYAPVILLLGAVGLWKFITDKEIIWFYLIAGIILSVTAAGIQSLKLSFDPIYFNYNTLYHIIQGVALIFLYFFFKKFRGQRKSIF